MHLSTFVSVALTSVSVIYLQSGSLASGHDTRLYRSPSLLQRRSIPAHATRLRRRMIPGEEWEYPSISQEVSDTSKLIHEHRTKNEEELEASRIKLRDYHKSSTSLGSSPAHFFHQPVGHGESRIQLYPQGKVVHHIGLPGGRGLGELFKSGKKVTVDDLISNRPLQGYEARPRIGNQATNQQQQQQQHPHNPTGEGTSVNKNHGIDSGESQGVQAQSSTGKSKPSELKGGWWAQKPKQ